MGPAIAQTYRSDSCKSDSTRYTLELYHCLEEIVLISETIPKRFEPISQKKKSRRVGEENVHKDCRGMGVVGVVQSPHRMSRSFDDRVMSRLLTYDS